MRVLKGNPPNINLIRNAFTIPKGTIFTYGDTIYNPDDCFIDNPILHHEMTHMLQQGDNPKIWWARYLVDNDFRFVQELQAYQNQYQAYCKHNRDRNKRNAFITKLADALSSEMYGKVCTKSEALFAIKNKMNFKIT